MGGSKNKSPAQKDKSQKKESSKKDGAKKSKKGDKSEGGPPKAEITVILNDDQALKIVKSAKVITVHDLARTTGVKVSAANVYLKKLLENNTVRIVGGNSGHRVYQPVSS